LVGVLLGYDTEKKKLTMRPHRSATHGEGKTQLLDWAELGHDAVSGRVFDAADRPTKLRGGAGRIAGFQAAR
jgi:hypothetical protein